MPPDHDSGPHDPDDQTDAEFLEALGRRDNRRAAAALRTKSTIGRAAVEILSEMFDPEAPVSTAFPYKLKFAGAGRGRPRTLEAKIRSAARARAIDEHVAEGKNLKAAILDVKEKTGKSPSTLYKDRKRRRKNRD